MNDMAKKARADMKEKAERLTSGRGPNNEKSDISSWQGDTFDGEDKVIDTPRKRAAFKSGGKVEGEKAKAHAGKKPRKHRDMGGPLAGPYDPRRNATAMMMNAANQAPVSPTQFIPAASSGRKSPFRLGFKKGGEAHSDRAQDMKLIKEEVKSSALKKKNGGWIKDAIGKPGALHKEMGIPKGEKIPEKKLDKAAKSDNPKLAKRANLAKTLRSFHKDGGKVREEDCDGGRVPRKSGGRAKGKTNVNIIIAQHPGMNGGQNGPQGAPMQPVPRPPMSPPSMPPGAMPPASMPPASMPNAGPPIMPRKRGGRTNYPLDAGAGSGEGRMEKVKAYGLKDARA